MINKSTLISFSQKKNYILDCIYSNIKRKFDWLRIGRSILSMLSFDGARESLFVSHMHVSSGVSLPLQMTPWKSHFLIAFRKEPGESPLYSCLKVRGMNSVWMNHIWRGSVLHRRRFATMVWYLKLFRIRLVFKSKNLNAKKQLWISFAAKIGS